MTSKTDFIFRKKIYCVCNRYFDKYKNILFGREREREMTTTTTMMMMMMIYSATHSARIQIVYMWLHWGKFHYLQCSLRWSNHWCLGSWGFDPPPSPKYYPSFPSIFSTYICFLLRQPIMCSEIKLKPQTNVSENVHPHCKV